METIGLKNFKSRNNNSSPESYTKLMRSQSFKLQVTELSEASFFKGEENSFLYINIKQI